MARIIVTADQTTDGAAPVLFDERIHPVHLSTGHAAMQLIERLGWALSDAEELERGQSGRVQPDGQASARPRRRRAAPRRRVTT